MNNTFDFSYFVPTPDTTANCALSRWNDGVMGLSDFLKAYMSSRQSLEFGFSRNLNIKELLNLTNGQSKDDENKNDYIINYRKFGDIKAHVCGFEIPIVDFLHPFLRMFWVYDYNKDREVDTLPYSCYVSHVFNYNSSLSESERVDNTIIALNNLKYDVENYITQEKIGTYFKRNLNGTYPSKNDVLTMLDNAINKISNMSSSDKSFIFGYSSKDDMDSSISSAIQHLNNGVYGSVSFNSFNLNLYRDLCYISTLMPSYGNTSNFILDINDNAYSYILQKYFYPNGISFVFAEMNCSPIYSSYSKPNHLMIFFRFNLTEKPTLAPFVSHDGTEIPLSEQKVSVKYSIEICEDQNVYNGSYFCSTYWDSNEECPVYFDASGNPHPMNIENNIDGMGGRDYTLWSSPVQKTENGYQFECCMPLAFYNIETDSYSNEYYATKSHDGIEIGEVMYRVPVVKRMRQNIEEAIVNTHLTKCLNDLVPATNENAEDDDTIVLGGVVVDDFTDGLYPVAEHQKIASETEYGDVKIVKATDDVLDLMYHYSETGELDYNNMSMPENGRAIDMITLFDVLKDFNGGNPVNEPIFLTDIDFDRAVTTHAEGSPTTGNNQTIYGKKTFKEKVSLDFDGNINARFIDMTSSDYESRLYGNSILMSTSYGPEFYTLNGGLYFSTSGHSFNLDVREDQNEGSIANTYKITNGGITKTLGRVSSGASYTYDGGTRYQNGKVDLEAKNAINSKRSAITLNSSSSTSNINVVSENVNLSVSKINGSEDGLEFDLNTEAGGSVVKVCVNPTDKSDLDTAHGISIDNTTTVTGFTNIHSTIESLVDPDGLTSYLNTNTSFSTYLTSIRSYSAEDEAIISLTAENVIGQGDLKSTLRLTQGNIQLITTSYNDPTKECSLTFCIKNEQNKLFYLYPSASTNYKVDLGDSSHKFGTIYADNYVGTIERARKDSTGNDIDDYVMDINTYASSSSSPSPFSIGYTRGNGLTNMINISETVANVLGKGLSASQPFGQLMLAVFKLEKPLAWVSFAGKYQTYGQIYDSSTSSDNTKLAYYGKLYEFSFGLSEFNTDTATGQRLYCWTDQYQDTEDVTTHFPRELTGKWLLLNSIYDYNPSSVNYMSIGYWVVLVLRFGN